MKNSYQRIDDPTFYWVDYEGERYMSIYLYWQDLAVDNFLKGDFFSNFLTKFDLLTQKYRIGLFLNRSKVEKLLLGSSFFEETWMNYIQCDSLNKWLLVNGVYDVGELVYPSEIFVLNNKKIKKETIVNIDPLVSYDEYLLGDKSQFAEPIKIDFNRSFHEKKIFVNAFIDNDIFFPYLWNKKTVRSDNKEVRNKGVDASQLAYLNTPRLNSFIRDLKVLCFEYGASTIDMENHWDHDTENPEYFSESGILLDGEIIYYEDVYDLLPQEHRTKEFKEIQLDLDTANYDRYMKDRAFK